MVEVTKPAGENAEFCPPVIPNKKIIVHQHRQIRIHQRRIHQMIQPDHRAAVANHHDRLQAAGSKRPIGQGDSRSESRRTPMRSVHRVRRRELRIGQSHAADVRDDHNFLRRQLQSPQRLAERAQNLPVTAAFAIRQHGFCHEVSLSHHAASATSIISAGVIMCPSPFTRTSRSVPTTDSNTEA